MPFSGFHCHSIRTASGGEARILPRAVILPLAEQDMMRAIAGAHFGNIGGCSFGIGSEPASIPFIAANPPTVLN